MSLVASGKELPRVIDVGTGGMAKQQLWDEDEYSIRLRESGVFPDLQGIEAFLRSLPSDEEFRQIGDRLVEQLGSKDFAMRQVATRELLRLPNPPLAILRDLVANSSDVEVRFRASRILARMEHGLGDSVLFATLQTIRRQQLQGLLPVLLPLVRSWDHETLLDAAREAVVATSTEQDLALLRTSLLAAAETLEVRIAALDALLHLSGNEGLEIAKPLLDDAPDSLRFELAMRFADLGRRESLEAFVRLLDSDDAGLRGRAQLALTALTGRTPQLQVDSPTMPGQLAQWWRGVLDNDPNARPLHYPVNQVLLLHEITQLGGKVRLGAMDRWIADADDVPIGSVSIRAINLRNSKLTDQQLMRITNLRELESLDLSSCHQISNAALRDIGRLRRLRHLSLENTRISDAAVAGLFQLPALEELRLGRLVTDAGLERIPARSVLRELSFSYSQVTDAGLNLLASLQRLQCLRLYRCPQVSDAGLAHVAQLRRLKKLILTCPRVTDEGLRSLSELKGLEHLDVYTTQVTSHGMRHVTQLPRLRVLNLSRTKIDDMAMIHVAQLKSLEQLDLSHTNISDSGLEPLRKLPRLTSLSLESTRVTGTGLIHLSQLGEFQSLRLYNSRLTDEGLAFAGRLSKLTHLDIGNTSVTDSGLRHVGDIRSLTSLDISRSPVSDDGLRHLRGMSRLVKLNRRRTKITQSGIQMLRKSVPTLADVR